MHALPHLLVWSLFVGIGLSWVAPHSYAQSSAGKEAFSGTFQGLQGGSSGQSSTGGQGPPQGAEGGRRRPPPEAVQACEGKTRDAACSFKAPDGQTRNGSCFAPAAEGQATQRPLACRPQGRPGNSGSSPPSR